MEDKQYRSYRDLVAWKAARNYKKAIKQLTACFPSEEKYRLEDQLIRASRSIGNNIAEGYGRYTYKDQIHFCMQARGSLFESTNHLIDAFDDNYIDQETLNKLDDQANEVEKLLNGYIAWLGTMTKGQ